jgi:phosphoserine phosphatase RsbU/P
LRQCAIGQTSAAHVVRCVNRALHADMPPGRFISLFYGILDLDTNRLSYVRAGHEPALLLRAAGGPPELLRAGGLALGFDAGPLFDAELAEGEAVLQPGDLLALYTDGINEAADAADAEFGWERLAAVLRQNASRPLAELPDAVDRELRRFAALATRGDDRTLLLVRPR